MASFFRIDGADSETGQETFLVLRAKSKPHAERLARKQGILISSVRVAKPADWKDAPAKAAPADPKKSPASSTKSDESSEPEEAEVPEPRTAAPSVPPIVAAPPLPPLPPASTGSARRGGSGASILLCAIGAALILGGSLALTLALWPDDGVRNELQQIDFRLHELSQTVLGGALVLAGAIALVLASVLRPAARRDS